ncbi:TMEM165/GDT1 family protein [Caldanaerobius polysaccharolyticus]|uniref:TMEM165/GDT1 family protein n=1 Tax=Caldanaerobius polysaccharolyticus TaxID=44256 RepID=UPI000479A626|nr:TMEM165/GDT1 family protein [Caldanaerobius polysaccharolyticus]
MHREVILSFFLVFLAELGDKTQLSTMLLASKYNNRLGVYIGASLALILSAFIGVIGGTFINKYLPQNLIQMGSGIAFIVVGLALLFNKF